MSLATMGDFRVLLLEISNELTKSDLADLKFLCRDVIQAGVAQNITRPFELFSLLEDRDKLSEGNRDFLASKLSAINKQWLRNKLLGIQEDNPVSINYNQAQSTLVNERQSFPSLHDVQQDLPPVPPLSPLNTVTSTGEPNSMPDSPGSTTYIPKFGSSPEREPVDEISCKGDSNEQDSTDYGEIPTIETMEAVRTGIPDAQTLRSMHGLDRDGTFLDPEKYDPIKHLGTGGFAEVYLIRERSTKQTKACKMCNLGVNNVDAQKKTKAVVDELSVLSAVKHQHIVEFYYAEVYRKTFLLFLEYMEGGSIADLLRQKGPLEESWIKKFTRQALIAVKFLHSQSPVIIHRDIKGDNILLDKPQMNIKLADFGISTKMNEIKTATGMKAENDVASIYWTSPELLGGKTFGRNTDIWSVGCTVIEMLTTNPPLHDAKHENLDRAARMFKIVNLEVEPPEACSSLAYGFLKKCLSARELRPSAAELLETDDFLKTQQTGQSEME